MSDVGRGLRWSDLKALIRFLPPDSHLKTLLNPDQAKAYRWLDPQVQLLGMLIDQNTGYPEGYVPVVEKILTPEPQRPRRNRSPLTAAEIRKRILG